MGNNRLRRHCEKLAATFAINKLLLLLIAVFFSLTSMSPHRTNFSGTWILNKSKSDYGQLNILCIFDGGDRMRCKTMKITQHSDFLTLDVTSPFPGAVPPVRHEKMTFDGKEIEGVGTRKTSALQWSADRQVMMVKSDVSLSIGGQKKEYKVTETWSVINNGKSLSLTSNITLASGTQTTMKLVFDKAS